MCGATVRVGNVGYDYIWLFYYPFVAFGDDGAFVVGLNAFGVNSVVEASVLVSFPGG